MTDGESRNGASRDGENTEDRPPDNSPEALEKRRLAQETRNERKVWYFLGYFLFGIHIVAFVMIYAVTHAPNK